MKEAAYWIEKLQLSKHPEGGWFSEVYRADEKIEKSALPKRYTSDRCFATSIYYLLENDYKSHFHRIQSDEIWHFYVGTSPVEVLMIRNKKLERYLLGSDLENGETLQLTIPRNTWFAAHLINESGYSLLGCSVSPGFEFADFELAKVDELVVAFPALAEIIRQFSS